MQLITKKIETLNTFDTITRFRLINAFIIAIGFNLFFPILIDLKGEYLVSWVISMFMIAETLMVKTNQFVLDNYSMADVYKMTVFVHGAFTLVAVTYFWNPAVMVYLESAFSIIDVAIFSAFSIQLNNYITDNFPKDMSNFQIFRNSTWADGILIGLTITTILTFFFSNAVGLIVFIIFNMGFSIWLARNWNFIESNLLEVKNDND